MDTTSITAAVLSSIYGKLSLSYGPSALYDTSTSWKPLLGAGQNFLEVLDIPFSPGEPARLLRKVTDIDNVNDAFRDLPTQVMGTIRVYFVENPGAHRDTLPIATPSFAGSPAMISQWGLLSKRKSWETCSYRLSLTPTLREARTENVDHSYIDSTSIAAGTIRRTLRCMIVSTEDGRIICEYIHPV